MRMPESPPDFQKIYSEFIDIPRPGRPTLNSPELTEFVQRSNDKYVHWDKLRRQNNLPPGYTAEMVWIAIAMARHLAYRPLPLKFGRERFVYWSPPQHVEWLHEIDQQAGGTLDARTPKSLRDDDRYLLNSLMEEAIASSQLEGAATTRRVAKQMLRENRKPRNRAERMILNNYKAICEIRESRNAKLSPNFLKHLQTVLTEGTLDDPTGAGRFRMSDDRVVVADLRTSETLFTPPPAESVEAGIEEICEFANQRSRPFIHPVVKAIVLHFALGYVHPFIDGNGRTARAVFYWYMLKHNYWLFEFLPLSRLFLQAPSKYARAYLYSETSGGDVTYFIHYHLRTTLRAIRELHGYLDRQRQERAETARLFQAEPDLNFRQQSLLVHAVHHPDAVYTIRQYQNENNVSYGTARSDLLSLVEKGRLKMSLRGKKLVFFPSV